MINRYKGKVPTKKNEQQLGKLTPLTKSPVRFTAVEDTATFAVPIDLGIFPKPAEQLKDQAN